MSEGVELRMTTNDTGRGLFATRAFEPGMNILNSGPYYHALASKYHGIRCSQCLISKPKLSRCAGCKLQYYCSKDCQKTAWKLHKEECKILKSLKSISDDENWEYMVFGRILLQIESDFGDEEKPTKKKDTLVNFLELESNYDRLTDDQQEDMELFLVKFQRYWKKPIPRAVRSSRKLLDLFAAIKNNQFAICDEESGDYDVGSAVYIDHALVNHSCRPNAYPVFNKTNMIFKALRKIAPGEEITHAYTDTISPIQERREYLNDVWRFMCNCPGCTKSNEIDRKKLLNNEGNVIKCSDQIWKSAQTMVSDMVEFKKKKEWSLMKEAAQGWLARKFLPEQNIFWIRLNEYAFKAGFETEDSDLCLSTGASLIVAYKELYGTTHPILGLHLTRFANILLKIKKPDEAEEYFRRAFGIISIFYEPNSTVRKNLLNSIMEAYELSQIQGDNKKKIENPAVTDEKPKLKNLFAELKANGQI